MRSRLYKPITDNASRSDVADNDFYAARGQLARVQRHGGWCGSAALFVMADMAGLDYVVIFDAVHDRNVRLVLLSTDVRAAGKLHEFVMWEASAEKMVRQLRAAGKSRGAYVVRTNLVKCKLSQSTLSCGF